MFIWHRFVCKGGASCREARWERCSKEWNPPSSQYTSSHAQ